MERTKNPTENRITTGQKLLITISVMTAALILFIVLTIGSRVRDDVSLETVAPKLLSEMTETQNMQAGGAMKLRALYGLSENDYEEVVLYVPASNMDAQEMLIIRCKTEEQTETVKVSAEKRIAYLRTIFESYGVEQMALINEAVVDVQGKYVLYTCCREAGKVDAAFKKALKGKGE